MNTIILKPSIKNDYLELHFNLWNSEKNNLKFLDIGIMCDNADQVFSLVIPSSKKLTIKDLTDNIKGDIRNSIFNCYVNMQTIGSYEILKKENHDEESFLLSPIKPKQEFSPTNDSELVTVEIKVKKVNKEDIDGIEVKRKYLRFRIEKFDISKFLITQDSDSKIFESSFIRSKIIDFRVNDYRILTSDKIQEYKLDDYSYKKIHFSIWQMH